MSNGCRALNDAELTQLLSYVKNIRDRAIIILGIKSGFRISEILSLKVCDVTQYGSIANRVTVNKRNMKGKVSSRSVPLHNDAISALQCLIALHSGPNDYLFQSREGDNKPLTACQAWRIIKRASKSAKLTGKIGSHSLRKTFAMKVYDASGKDLVATQRALGHASCNSTTKYIQVGQDTIDNIILGV